jgi:hypothetical protein
MPIRRGISERPHVLVAHSHVRRDELHAVELERLQNLLHPSGDDRLWKAVVVHHDRLRWHRLPEPEPHRLRHIDGAALVEGAALLVPPEQRMLPGRDGTFGELSSGLGCGISPATWSAECWRRGVNAALEDLNDLARAGQAVADLIGAAANPLEALGSLALSEFLSRTVEEA